MAQEPNRLLRALVPLVLLVVVGGGIFYAVLKGTAPRTGTPAPATAASTPAATTPAAPGAAPADAAQTPAATQTPPTAPATTPPAPPPITGVLSARAVPFAGYDPIGSITPSDKGGQYEMEVWFTPVGAGFERVSLANHFEDAQRTTPEIVQSFRHAYGMTDPRAGLAGLAANRVEINGKWVAICDTGDVKSSFWKQIDGKPGSFEAIVEDGDHKEVARIARVFALQPKSFEIEVHQGIENLTGAPMSVRWEQFGPVSPPVGAMRYGGDVRRVRFGFMLPAAKDPDRTILADDRAASLISHRDAIGAKENGQWQAKILWPSADSEKSELTLAWAGMTNRYYTVAEYPIVPAGPSAPAGAGAARAFTLVESVHRYAVDTTEKERERLIADIALVTTSPVMKVEAGKSADVSMGVYAGPTSKAVMGAQAPAAAAQGVGQVVMYTFGGPCSICTFQAVTAPLHGLLSVLHDYVTHDWALSIMLLVVCVRTIMHPITRWTQRRMFFFSKEMAKIAPKMKAIQEKYKDDPVKLREEQTRMMGEHGGVYASGALGCLPAFLQSPVWIALSAMIGFAFELHNTPAFFGMFQRISPSWSFLNDLSSPDKLIPFGTSFHLPLLGDVDGLNLLPILLGIVFYIQQKYLTPPPTAPLTPEQEQQQKIMKVMTVVMFPLMMYNAPAGLALYFATNSSLAILESKAIRRKAEEEWKEREAVKAARAASGIKTKNWWERKGAAGGETQQPQGWLARLRQMQEQAMKMREEQKKRNTPKGKK